MRAAVQHMKDPVLEVLLFSVAGVRYGVALKQVVGLVQDLPREDAWALQGNAHLLLFEGRQVPVFPADDFLYDVGPRAQDAREALIFDDGAGLYGISIDATHTVVEVTPGDDLYVLPPQEVTDQVPCRAWGILTVADRPIILLDMSRVSVH